MPDHSLASPSLRVPQPALSLVGVFDERVGGAVGEGEAASGSAAVDFGRLDMQSAARGFGVEAHTDVACRVQRKRGARRVVGAEQVEVDPAVGARAQLGGGGVLDAQPGVVDGGGPAQLQPPGGQPGQPAPLARQRGNGAVVEADLAQHHLGAVIGKARGVAQPHPRRVHQRRSITQQPLHADLQVAHGQIAAAAVAGGGQAHPGGIHRHGGNVGHIGGIDAGIGHRQPTTGQHDQMPAGVDRGPREMLSPGESALALIANPSATPHKCSPAVAAWL